MDHGMSAHFRLNVSLNGKHYALIDLGMGYCTEDNLAEVRGKARFIEAAFRANPALPSNAWRFTLTHWAGSGADVEF